MPRVLSCLSSCAVFLLVSHVADAETPGPPLPDFRVELQGYGGVVLPDRASDFGAGPNFGGMVLIRPLSWLAVGFFGERSRVAWRASDLYPDESVAITTVGGTLRIYALNESWAEPYLQLALATNQGDASASGGECGGASGGGAQFGFGFDAYLLPWIRPGASFAMMLGPSGSGQCNIPLSSGDTTQLSGWPPSIVLRGGVTFVLGGPPTRGLL